MAKPGLWWLSQPAALINQLSVPAVGLLFVSLPLHTGVGQSLTQTLLCRQSSSWLTAPRPSTTTAAVGKSERVRENRN